MSAHSFFWLFSALQENLLIDEDHNLKLIDFGLCAKPKVHKHSLRLCEILESISCYRRLCKWASRGKNILPGNLEDSSICFISGRFGLWAHDVLWKSCICCSWAHPGESLHWLRGKAANQGRGFWSKLCLFHTNSASVCPWKHLVNRVCRKSSALCFRARIHWGMSRRISRWNTELRWCFSPRLMCGVWGCCSSLCSVDICHLMMTTAWSSTRRLQ